MNKPDWFVLIEQWVPSGMGSEGVTFPYLIGALALNTDKTNVDAQEIRQALENMVSNPMEGYVIEVMWCGNIKAPVFKVLPIDSSKRMKSSCKITHPSGQGESLVFSENLSFYLKAKDPSELLERLIEDASKPVSEGNFSRQRSLGTFMEFEYGKFSERDLEYIERTISNR